MKTEKITLLSILILICWIGTASANQFSGAYLLRLCSKGQNGEETVPGGHIACQAYISGVIDSHKLIQSLQTSKQTSFCIPEGEPLVRVQEKVHAFLKANPGNDPFVAGPAVALALLEHYPCQK